MTKDNDKKTPDADDAASAGNQANTARLNRNQWIARALAAAARHKREAGGEKK